MRKFELCFTFPDDHGRYLIPELLDKQQPEEAERFQPEECLNFQYHYPVLPEGLLPRFIVRTHVLSTEQPRWRTGVILDWEGNRALVKADKEDKRVFINVQGRTPRGRRELLLVIRHDFDHIHRSFTFKPQEMIPVPEAPDLLVAYQDLLVMEQDGVRKFLKVVGDRTRELDVEKLLSGVDLDDTLRVQRKEQVDRAVIRVFCSYSHKDELLRAELEHSPQASAAPRCHRSLARSPHPAGRGLGARDTRGTRAGRRGFASGQRGLRGVGLLLRH